MIKLLLFLLFRILIAAEGNVIKQNTTTANGNTSTLNGTEASQSSIISTYLDKICKNEPTCNMIDQIPKNQQTLEIRNCMCDSDCVTFGDCCLDSPFYNTTEQHLSNVYDSFHCDAGQHYYIKRTCPPTFEDSDVKQKCEAGASMKYKSIDQKLIAPVTDTKQKITYENQYCALCNGITDYISWNIRYRCWPKNGTAISFVGDHKARNKSNKTEGDNVHKHVTFNSVLNSFESNYKDVHFKCWQLIDIPSIIQPLLRKCIPTISTCSGTYDEQIAGLCKSASLSKVYFSHIAYKNKYCALCNGPKENILGCTKYDDGGLFALVPSSAFSSVFAENNKAEGSIDICKSSNEELKEKFC